MKKVVLGMFFLIFVFVFAFSCGSDNNDNENSGTDTKQEETKEDVKVSDAEGESVSNSGCKKCGDMKGWAFRFTTLWIQDPDVQGLKDFLNDRWSRDIENDLLNIIFEIKEFDPENGIFTVIVGPGWKNEDGNYYILKDYAGEFKLTIDKSCKFKTTSYESLYFHAGELSAPVNCAPELPKPNAIPITGLSADGTFQIDCETGKAYFKKGYLSGCIDNESAHKICTCNKYEGDKNMYVCSTELSLDPEADYCQKKCGDDANWANFGAFLEVLKNGKLIDFDEKCKEITGNDAFKLAGEFEAERILNYIPIDEQK